MREILFRGKSVNDGNWVQGSLVVTKIEPADDAPIKHYHIEDMTIGVFPNEFQSGLSETVDPETVGQFTGLTDKNGKRIFEGDIVRFAERRIGGEDVFVVEQVAFDEGGFCTHRYFLNNWLRNGLCRNTKLEGIEVIGNIHDNPELLEG